MQRTITFSGAFARLTVRVGKGGEALVLAEADSPEAMGHILGEAARHLGIPLLPAQDERRQNGNDPMLFLAGPAAT